MATQLKVQQISFSAMVEKMFENGRNKLAQAFLNDQDVLSILRDSAAKQVTDMRLTARQIRAQMLALKDPLTQALEPMERLAGQREKMIVFAGRLHKVSQLLREEAAGVPNDSGRIVPSDELVALAAQVNITVQKSVFPAWMNGEATKLDAQIAQGAQEIKALSSGELAMYEDTYAVLEESYQVSLANLKQAEEVLRQIEVKAPGIMLAIETHKQALALADKAHNQTADDNGVNNFMSDLQGQMTSARAEYRADKVVDQDLDAQTPVSFADMAMAQYDINGVDVDIMAEIAAAAG